MYICKNSKKSIIFQKKVNYVHSDRYLLFSVSFVAAADAGAVRDRGGGTFFPLPYFSLQTKGCEGELKEVVSAKNGKRISRHRTELLRAFV